MASKWRGLYLGLYSVRAEMFGRFTSTCLSATSRLRSQHILNYCRNDAPRHPRSFPRCTYSSLGLLTSEELRAQNGRGFDVLTDRALKESEVLVSKICSLPPGKETVRLFDILSDTLCQVADLAECLRNLHPNPQVVMSAHESIMRLSECIETLNTHRGLYASLDAVLSNPGVYGSLDPVTQRVAHSFMHDFLINGVHLEDQQREKVVELHGKILEMGQAFVSNMPNDFVVPKSHFPPRFTTMLRSAPNHEDCYQISMPDANAVLQADSSEETRRLVYCAQNAVVPSQLEVLENLVHYRHQLATTVGYPSYAHLAVQRKMVESPEKLLDFLHSLSSANLQQVQREVDSLRSLKVRDKGDADAQIEFWDVMYYMDQVDPTLMASSNALTIKEYFSFDSCFKGLNDLYSLLYGISLIEEPASTSYLWDSSVKKIRVHHEREGTLGYILGDFFTSQNRESYSNCHFTLRGGRRLDNGEYQMPVIVVCCDIPPSNPCLMSFSNVESLFHEMGHALHSMLGRTHYQQVTGTRCTLDFAEIPSTLNEVFLKDPRVIQSFAKHYRTQEPIPDSVLQSLLQYTNSFPAFNLQTQIMYAVFDVMLHMSPMDGKSAICVWKEVVDTFSPLPHVPNTAWFLQFSHLHVYGGKYFSYLWARAIANLIWRDCFSEDPFSRAAGEQYRYKMLGHGGEFPAVQLVSELLGYEPSTADLVSALTNDPY